MLFSSTFIVIIEWPTIFFFDVYQLFGFRVKDIFQRKFYPVHWRIMSAVAPTRLAAECFV